MNCHSASPLAFAASLVAALFSVRPALADEPPASNTPMYTAPLYQTTQPSYVPQSIALSGPARINDYREGEPIPPGYRKIERPRTGLIVGGAVTFGSLYFFSLLTATANGDAAGQRSNPAAALYVPALGPFVQMAVSESSTARLFLAIDGIAQSAGIAMLIYGMSSNRTILARTDLAANKRAPKPQVSAAPLVGRGTTGFGLVGNF